MRDTQRSLLYWRGNILKSEAHTEEETGGELPTCELVPWKAPVNSSTVLTMSRSRAMRSKKDTFVFKAGGDATRLGERCRRNGVWNATAESASTAWSPQRSQPVNTPSRQNRGQKRVLETACDAVSAHLGSLGLRHAKLTPLPHRLEHLQHRRRCAVDGALDVFQRRRQRH